MFCAAKIHSSIKIASTFGERERSNGEYVQQVCAQEKRYEISVSYI